MKIVQSFWSAPSTGMQVEESRIKGGWPAERYHLYSLALSFSLLQKWYPSIELVTDTKGAELLSEKLHLKYARISTDLDSLKDYPSSLWSMPKLYAYSVQNEPFLHVDGDVFIWEPFKTDFEGNKFLLVQSPELEQHASYEKPLKHFQSVLKNLPDCLTSYSNSTGLITAINAGVLGGDDLEFINYYATRALALINDNIECLRTDPMSGYANTIIEQYFFKQLAEQSNKKVNFLFNNISSNFQEILLLDQVPINAKYVHLLGNAKKRYLNCIQLENRLRYHFPEVYKHINLTCSKDDLFEASSFLPEGNKDAPVYKICIETSPGNGDAHNSAYGLHLSLNPGIGEFEVVDASLDLPRRSLVAISGSDSVNPAELVCTIANLTDFGFSSLEHVYDFMAVSSIEQLLETAFTLAACASIIEIPADSLLCREFSSLLPPVYNASNDIDFYIINKVAEKGVFIQPLVNWEQLLTYFQDSTLTGMELIELIDSHNSENTPRKQIKSLVFGFLCYHLVHTGNLSFADKVFTT